MSHEPSDSEVDALVRANPSGMTLDQISVVLGVTRQRCDQIEKRAMEKLQRELRWRRIGGVGDLT